MRLKRWICLLAGVSVLLCSCAQKSNEKQKLKEVLFGEYRAEIRYAFSSEGEELSGEATVTKGDTTTVTFHSPDSLSDVTAQSGADGLTDTITFEYYGMRVPLPQGALTKMNLLLSLFSGETAAAVTELSGDAFRAAEISADGAELFSCTVPLSCGGSAVLVVDKNSGYPVSFSAEYQNARVHGEIIDFTT